MKNHHKTYTLNIVIFYLKWLHFLRLSCEYIVLNKLSTSLSGANPNYSNNLSTQECMGIQIWTNLGLNYPTWDFELMALTYNSFNRTKYQTCTLSTKTKIRGKINKIYDYSSNFTSIMDKSWTGRLER